MEKDWKLVYFTGDNYRSVIAKELLEENDIHAVVINRKDSSYTTFGDLEVYVSNDDEEQANKILEHLKSGDS
jgi:DNA-binding LacI/PurR family transcriptional regulator